MDHIFAELIEETTPVPNRLIMEGLAVHQMKFAKEYLDQAFLSANESFPPGLKYVGFEPCTPEEEFVIVTKLKNNKRVFDLSKSDLYMVKIMMEYNGVPIAPRYIYLPYVDQAGIIHLGGTKYHITPVLSDKVLSPGKNDIFVRLLRDKITVYRNYHSLVINDRKQITYVAWSKIYDKKAKKKGTLVATTKAESTAGHYLLCKYGLAGVFKRYIGVTPIYGYDEINSDTYPASDWVIYQSSHARSKVPPKTYRMTKSYAYNPPSVRFAIPITHADQFAASLFASVFYVIDHFPEEFRLEPGIDPAPWFDDLLTWNVCMGNILWSSELGQNKLLENMSEHMASLDHYADNMVIRLLEGRGYKGVENFYDVLALIIKDFEKLLFEGKGSNLSMYGKSLETLYYVFYDITEGLFTANFKLNKQIQKRPITEKDIAETMKKYLRLGAIYELRSGKIVAEAVAYSGDNMYPKLTSKIGEQANRSGSSRGGEKRVVLDESKYLDPSMIDAGSALFLSKTNPMPTGKINLFANVDPATGTVLPQPELVELIDHMRDVLRIKE